MVGFLKRNLVSRISSRINKIKKTTCMLEDFHTNSKVCLVYLEENLHSCKTLEWHLTKLKSIQTTSLLKRRKKQKYFL